jgi:nitrous oxidase accessory protein
MKIALRFFICLLWTGFILTASANRVRVTGQIQKAIDRAGKADTIVLAPGLYQEGTLRITRPVTLLGETGAILDGRHEVELLLISGSNVTVSNIRFQNSGYSPMNDYAAIKIIDATGIRIEHNEINHAYFAIHVSNSHRVTIRNNKLKGKPGSEQLTGNGIHLWKCDDALIEKNQVTGHRDGIYFEFVTNSHINDNLSTGNMRYGLHFMFSHNDRYTRNIFRNNGAGVAVMFSKKVVMEQNLFDENWGAAAYGILLKEITDSKIERNRFIRNTIGIYMEGSNRIQVTSNQFSNNGWAARVQASCEDNNFSQNNFSGNSFDIATNGRLVLNRFDNNYWDKYDGYDLNRDGTGDVPFHPVSVYAMLVEQNPASLMLMRSFFVNLIDKAERAIPSLTPAELVDKTPHMKPFQYDQN